MCSSSHSLSLSQNIAGSVWNSSSLSWVKGTQASGGGGGGGGLVQIQDSAGNNLNSTSGALNVALAIIAKTPGGPITHTVRADDETGAMSIEVSIEDFVSMLADRIGAPVLTKSGLKIKLLANVQPVIEGMKEHSIHNPPRKLP